MVRTLLFFNIENDFYNYIFMVIFIVIVLGVNGPLAKNIQTLSNRKQDNAVFGHVFKYK